MKTNVTQSKVRAYVGLIDDEEADRLGYCGRVVRVKLAIRCPLDPHGVVTWIALRRLHENVYDPIDLLDQFKSGMAKKDVSGFAKDTK